MVMKRTFFFLLSILALTQSACGNDNQEAALPSAPVEASFAIQPTEPSPGEAITFSVQVTQDGKAVDDANEVKFEWWKEGQDKHVTIPATLQKDGVYTAQQTIAEPGSYFVYYHVTARDFHNMQKVPFTVKGTSGAAGAPAQQPDAGTEHDHGNEQKSSDHHASGVDFHFMPPDSIKASESAPLTVHLMKDNQAFTQATVKYEFWQGNDGKHSFLDASETQPGQYGANASFPASGTYTVKVHVEKGDVHDHKEFNLSVQ